MSKPFRFIQGFFLVILLHSCASTPPIHHSLSQDGIEPLTELIKLPIGGVEQWLLIRTANTENPVFFFLHGGPGAGEMPLLRYFNNELEQYFTVVTWDQRGAGKSNSRDIPPHSINLDQLRSDTHEIVQYLKNRFNQPKVFIAGHSFGTVLGIQLVKKHPENIYAYVGIGQIVNTKRNTESTCQLGYELARETGKKKDISIFSDIYGNGSSADVTDLETALTLNDFLKENGGVYHDRTTFNKLIFAVLTAPEYTLLDKIKYMSGLKRSRELLWNRDLFEVDFFRDAPRLEVPVYFISGKYDLIASPELTLEYYNFLSAPEKHLVEFKDSAHCGIFEEPSKFNRLMIDEVLKHAHPSTDTFGVSTTDLPGDVPGKIRSVIAPGSSLPYTQ